MNAFTNRKSIQIEELENIRKKSTVVILGDNGNILELDVEEYVVGVLLAEMPASFQPHALMAQSVLARTYAYKRSETHDKHQQYALCTKSTCCQGYCDVNDYSGSPQDVAKIKNAVRSTKGLVLTYEGELIEAAYFSCSGGKTEAAVAVWGMDVPYLQVVDSPGEEFATHYQSAITLEGKVFLDKLGLSGDAVLVNNISHTDGGGVDQITINDITFRGTQVRQLLGLKSTAFRITITGKQVIVTVKGYGHRVGMSQYGAEAMALRGCSYAEILSHYYKGTVLTDKSL